MSGESVVDVVSSFTNVLCWAFLAFNKVYYIGSLAINEVGHGVFLLGYVAVEGCAPEHVSTCCTVFGAWLAAGSWFWSSWGEFGE